MAERLCLVCGETVPGSHPRHEPAPGCSTPDACTLDMTTTEAAAYWRRTANELFAELELMKRHTSLTPEQATGTHGAAAAGPVPHDVRRLVIAARRVAYATQPSPDALQELDRAAEAFAGRVPWEDEENG